MEFPCGARAGPLPKIVISSGNGREMDLPPESTLGELFRLLTNKTNSTRSPLAPIDHCKGRGVGSPAEGSAGLFPLQTRPGASHSRSLSFLICKMEEMIPLTALLQRLSKTMHSEELRQCLAPAGSPSSPQPCPTPEVEDFPLLNF